MDAFVTGTLPQTKQVEVDVNQGSGTYGSRARWSSFDDGIWLAWYFLNPIVKIFLQFSYRALSNIMQHQKSH